MAKETFLGRYLAFGLLLAFIFFVAGNAVAVFRGGLRMCGEGTGICDSLGGLDVSALLARELQVAGVAIGGTLLVLAIVALRRRHLKRTR